jgi:hypothetical protein
MTAELEMPQVAAVVAPARLALVLRLAGHIAAGVAHLHAHGVVHADIKPANCLLQSCWPFGGPDSPMAQTSAGGGPFSNQSLCQAGQVAAKAVASHGWGATVGFDASGRDEHSSLLVSCVAKVRLWLGRWGEVVS